jgi:[acyl-carrier-protein] S-malonyltransferase
MANRNSDNQFVLSGELAAVAEAETLALEAGARRALILTIPLPAHSPLMDKAGAAFRAVLDRLAFAVPAYPILANATGEVMASVDSLRQELGNHLLRPVDWARTMVEMRRMRVKTVVELGPGRVLASLAQKHIPGVTSWNADELFIDFAEPPVPAT